MRATTSSYSSGPMLVVYSRTIGTGGILAAHGCRRNRPSWLAPAVGHDEEHRRRHRQHADQAEVPPAERACERAIHLVAHYLAIVPDQEDREEGERQHGDGQDHRILSERDRVNARL